MGTRAKLELSAETQKWEADLQRAAARVDELNKRAEAAALGGINTFEKEVEEADAALIQLAKDAQSSGVQVSQSAASSFGQARQQVVSAQTAYRNFASTATKDAGTFTAAIDRNRFALIEGSRAVDDFFAAFATGGVAGGLRGAANNITQIGASFGPIGALATTAAVVLGTIFIPKLLETGEEAEDAANKLESLLQKLRDAESESPFEIQFNTGGLPTIRARGSAFGITKRDEEQAGVIRNILEQQGLLGGVGNPQGAILSRLQQELFKEFSARVGGVEAGSEDERRLRRAAAGLAGRAREGDPSALLEIEDFLPRLSELAKEAEKQEKTRNENRQLQIDREKQLDAAKLAASEKASQAFVDHSQRVEAALNAASGRVESATSGGGAAGGSGGGGGGVSGGAAGAAEGPTAQERQFAAFQGLSTRDRVRRRAIIFRRQGLSPPEAFAAARKQEAESQRETRLEQQSSLRQGLDAQDAAELEDATINAGGVLSDRELLQLNRRQSRRRRDAVRGLARQQRGPDINDGGGPGQAAVDLGTTTNQTVQQAAQQVKAQEAQLKQLEAQMKQIQNFLKSTGQGTRF